MFDLNPYLVTVDTIHFALRNIYGCMIYTVTVPQRLPVMNSDILRNNVFAFANTPRRLPPPS